MRLIATVSLGFLPIVICAQLPTDNPIKTKNDSAVHAAVSKFFEKTGHTALGMVVYERGRTTLYHYGSVSRDKPQIPDRRSLFEIASLTKTFTGALLAKAVAERKVDIDNDIRVYLREQYPNLEYRSAPVTLRVLTTHQSGLPNNIPDNSELFRNPDFEKLPFQLVDLEKSYHEKKYRQELHDIRLDTIPGSVYFRYSNIGIKLVSFVLEDVYGISYKEMLERNILKPLGMNNTSVVLTEKDSLKLTKGYSSSGKLMPYSLENAGAAGGLKSSTEDMAKYLAWHMREKDQWVRETHALLHGDVYSYARGYNWNVELKEGRRKVFQTGGSYGMSSAMIMYPLEQVGFVLLANDGGMDTQGQLQDIASEVLEALTR